MRAATMRNPAFSKRARIWPIAFFRTASGLMIESVCSTAMDRRSPQEIKILTGHFTPFRQHAGRIFPRLVAAIDAKPGHPHHVFAAHEHGQPIALPWRHAGLLEKVFQRAPRPARVGLQPLAAGAQPDRERLGIGGNAFAARAPEAQLAAERRDRKLRLALPRDRRERTRGAIGDDPAAVDAQPRTVVLDERAASARRELLQHLDELGLARRAQAALL